MAAIIAVALIVAWLFIGNYLPKIIRYIISAILDVVAIVLFIMTPMSLIIRIIIIVLLQSYGWQSLTDLMVIKR